MEKPKAAEENSSKDEENSSPIQSPAPTKAALYSNLVFIGAGVIAGAASAPFCDPTTTLCRPEAILMHDEPTESLPRAPQPPPPGSLINIRPASTATTSMTTIWHTPGWPPKV